MNIKQIIIRHFRVILFLFLAIFIFLFFKVPKFNAFIVNLFLQISYFVLFDNTDTGYVLKSWQELLYILFTIIAFIFAFKFFFRRYLKDLEHLSMMPKNTYKYGRARFASMKEKKRRFSNEEQENVYSQGWLTSSYKKISFKIFGMPILVLNKNWFKPEYETKNLDKLTKEAQMDYFSEKEHNFNFKEVLDNLVKNKYIKLIVRIISIIAVIEIKAMVMIDEQPVHIVIIGTTRSGKTQTWVFSQIKILLENKNYKKKASLVVSDPKGEIFNYTAQMAYENGYDVLPINTKDFMGSVGYNPLKAIIDLYFIEIKKYFDLFDWRQIKQTSNENNKKFHEFLNQFYEIQEIISDYNKGIDPTNDFGKRVIKKILIRKEEIRNNPDCGLKDYLKESLNFSSMEQELGIITSGLIEVADGGDAFFGEMAKSYLNIFIRFQMISSVAQANVALDNDCAYLLDENFKLFLNLNNVISQASKYLVKTSTGCKWDEVRKNISSLDPMSRLSFSEDSINTFNNGTRIFSDENMKRITALQDVDLDKIVRGFKPCIIYLITPDYDSQYNGFVSLFVNQLYNKLAKHTELIDDALARKVFFILDEFANIPAIDGLTNKLTVCLGRGIQFAMIIQNLAQLDDRYSPEIAKTIRDNSQLEMYLLAGDVETRQTIADSYGKTTILEKSKSGSDVKGESVSWNEKEMPIMTQEVLGLNPMGVGYLSVLRSNPMKNYFRPAFTYWNFSKNKKPNQFFKENNMIVQHASMNVNDLVIKDRESIRRKQLPFDLF